MNKFDYILSIFTYILELVVDILTGSSANLFNSPTVPAMYKSFFVTGILIRSLIYTRYYKKQSTWSLSHHVELSKRSLTYLQYKILIKCVKMQLPYQVMYSLHFILYIHTIVPLLQGHSFCNVLKCKTIINISTIQDINKMC